MTRKNRPDERIGIPRGFRNTAANVRAARWVLDNSYRGKPHRSNDEPVTEVKHTITQNKHLVRRLPDRPYMTDIAISHFNTDNGIFFAEPVFKVVSNKQRRSCVSLYGAETYDQRLNVLSRMSQTTLHFTVSRVDVYPHNRTKAMLIAQPDRATHEELKEMDEVIAETLGIPNTVTIPGIPLGIFRSVGHAAHAAVLVTPHMTQKEFVLPPAEIAINTY